jgi:hypothetical protein
MEIVADRHLSPPMHHEARAECQEHQRKNGYKTLRVSLSQTSETNYQTCVLHDFLLCRNIGI